MRDVDETLRILRQLDELGVRLAVDGFGAGSSSFMCLRRFPIDAVKIDRSFVRDVPGDTGAAAIVRAIAGMAHSLNHAVAAEGVETPAQLQFLREAGCDEYQGYLYSPAVQAEKFAEFLRSESGPHAVIGR